MTILLDDTIIRLQGVCRVEEAETLTALLQGNPGAGVDLSACTGLHAAVLQVMLAFGPAVFGEPDDTFLRSLLPSLAARPPTGTSEAAAFTRSNVPVHRLEE